MDENNVDSGSGKGDVGNAIVFRAMVDSLWQDSTRNWECTKLLRFYIRSQRKFIAVEVIQKTDKGNIRF